MAGGSTLTAPATRSMAETICDRTPGGRLGEAATSRLFGVGGNPQECARLCFVMGNVGGAAVGKGVVALTDVVGAKGHEVPTLMASTATTTQAREQFISPRRPLCRLKLALNSLTASATPVSEIKDCNDHCGCLAVVAWGSCGGVDRGIRYGGSQVGGRYGLQYKYNTVRMDEEVPTIGTAAGLSVEKA